MSEALSISESQQHELDYLASVELRRIAQKRSIIARVIVGSGIAAALTAGVIAAVSSHDEEPSHIEHAQTPSEIADIIDSYEPQASAHPLGTPQKALHKTAGSYKFLATEPNNADQPVRWDPCKPIHYVVNPDGAPVGGDDAIKKGITNISEVTGLKFIYDGTTDENVTVGRPDIDVERYGRRRSPVLVDWVTPKDYPSIKGYAGLGGPDMIKKSNNTFEYISGVVTLNQEHFNDLSLQGNAGYFKKSAITIHEFGHLVGLEHVDNPNEIMYKIPTEPILGDGDRRGLELLGSGDCL